MIKPRDWVGGLFGLLVFLIGVGLLALTFREAFHLFSVPASDALGKGKPGEPFDLNKAGNTLFALLWRIALLLGMCVIGSVIANRGIKMYQSSRGEIYSADKPKDPPKAPAPSEESKAVQSPE